MSEYNRSGLICIGEIVEKYNRDICLFYYYFIDSVDLRRLPHMKVQLKYEIVIRKCVRLDNGYMVFSNYIRYPEKINKSSVLRSLRENC